MKKIIAIIVFAALPVILTGCSGNDGTTFVDTRDGKKYKTVKIGNQTWMAENLNYETKNSKCFDNDPANCAKYGRLYKWNDAKAICPAGWHLPSAAEWDTLENTVGSSQAGEKLKSKTGWNENGNGTDEYGFSALPGGSGRSSDGTWWSIGSDGAWWSASETDDAPYAWQVWMSYEKEDVGGYGNDKANLYSVRCVED